MKKLLTILIGVSLALGTVTLTLAGEQDPNGQPGATQEDGAKKARKGKRKGKRGKGGKGKRHKNPDGTQTPPAATPPAQP
jgi:hypothetical protein